MKLKVRKDSKMAKILAEIKKRSGMTTTECRQFMVESRGDVWDSVAHRGRYSAFLTGTIHPWFREEAKRKGKDLGSTGGVLHRFCRKDQRGKWQVSKRYDLVVPKTQQDQE